MPEEKEKALQEWELDARLMDVAMDEGMSQAPEPGLGQPDPSKTLPEVKKAQKDLGAKPLPDEGSPTRSTP